MNGNDSVLAVYLGKKKIAHLSFSKEQLIWQYTNEWQVTGFAMSPHLPLSNEIPTININRFLRNLLPEGHAFDELIQNVHVSRNSTFALIRALGLDTSGALILRQLEEKVLEEGTLRLLTEDELVARLDNREVTGLIIWDGKPRLSVAGIQDKINLVVDLQGRFGFGDGALCSTHILKFEKQTQTNLVMNEYVTMCLAKACGLKVADVMLQKYGKHWALLVKRFDRKLVSNDEIKRRHIIDGCQALNLSPEYKYERNFGSGRDVAHIRDGASLPLLFEFANDCQNPALTKQQILDWLLFNVIVCNFDAHGKNISFYVGPQGISLAPFYDLVNIKLYPEVDQDFAMALGDEFGSDEINAYQLADFAESCLLSQSYVAKRLKSMVEKIMLALPQEIANLNKQNIDELYFLNYEKIITQRCHHFLEQCDDLVTINL